MECSYSEDVRRTFLSYKLTIFLGGKVTHWKTDEPTKGMRVQVILFVGGCCRAFDLPRHASQTFDNDAERFLLYFRQQVMRIHKDFDADPKPLASECPGHGTLDIEADGAKDKVDAVGFVRYSSLLFDSTPVLSRVLFLFEKRQRSSSSPLSRSSDLLAKAHLKCLT